MIGFVTFLLGGFILFKTFRDNEIFKKTVPLVTYTGMAKQFKIPESCTYAITVEGSNFDQFSKDQIRILDAVSKEPVEVKLTNESHTYFRSRRRFYSDIANFFATKNQLMEIEVTNYDKLRTYLSRYRIVDKYAQDRPPKIKVFKYISSNDRILGVAVFIVGFFTTAFGLALIIINLRG